MASTLQSIKLTSKAGLNLLPSFLIWESSNDQSVDSSPGAEVFHKTRYTSLDGLRGVAAFCVFTYHTIYAYDVAIFFGNGVSYSTASSCYEWGINEKQYNQRSRLLQLPLIRILVMGPSAVAMFFIISGFVLTQRPLRLARDQQWDSVLNTLSSATFRRPLRLFLPLFVATFVSMLLTYLNLMDNGLDKEDCMTYTHEPAVHVARHFSAQFVHWLQVVWQSLNVWDWSLYMPPYDHHLWTISVEFRASMALFLATLMLCRLRSWVRLLIVCLSIAYSVLWFRWDMALFLCGMFFAETSQIKNSRASALAEQSFKEPLLQQNWWLLTLFLSSRLLLYLLLLFSLYLISTPGSCSAFTPGYSFLAYIAPKSLSPHFWYNNMQFHQSIGAILFVALLIHWTSLNPLPSIFNTRIAQYLGRISYGLYIVHGPILHLFGYRLFPVMWSLTGRDTSIRYATGWLMAYTIIMMAVIWLADLFNRGIDEPFVRLARRLEKKVLRKEEGLIRLS
ncbi:MAG: hypothetical protein M1812_006905 [Candelaria pacifica]|nr:MAG: hypothetical protein M1812_006905 [Candelaria pacifica]